MTHRKLPCGALTVLLASAPSFAGEIAGLASNTPLMLDRPLEFSFSNDLLGRGGSVDDFRTQQFIISGTVGERWEVNIDHSLLTLIDVDEPARTDQLSVTGGYRLINRRSDTAVTRLTTGLGLRAYGDFGGERIQNGSHQLVSSSVEVAPYTDLDRTDATAWIDAHRYSLIKGTQHSSDWRWGYWLRGSALWTSDGQVDAAAGAYGVAGKGSIDLWLGLRHDWRSGYDDPVVVETALAEEDLAAVFGVRWGPVLFETVQQLDNKASYGQVRLIAAGFGDRTAPGEESRFALGAAITAPDVHLDLTGRWRAPWLNAGESRWRRALFVTGRYGEPQHDDDPLIYRRTQQLTAGIEWQRLLDVAGGSAQAYLSLGAGWREERIFGDEERAGERSDAVGRGVAQTEAGLRFDAGELIYRYNLRIQLGLAATYPFGEDRVEMSGATFRLQQPGVAITLGLVIGRFAD